MGKEAIIAALCWFGIGKALAVNDLRNDASASRLYHNSPGFGVYASGAPYGAHSHQVPLIAPKPGAKPYNYSFQNMNAFLKDSYGNRFVESKQSPQMLPFKPFPQQYIQLQELPAHFAQPLPAPSFAGFKQATPQIIVGSQYKLPSQSLPSASPIKQQLSFPHQGIYAGNIKSLAPQLISSSQFHGPVNQLPVQGQYSLPGHGFHYGSRITHSQPKPESPIPNAQPQPTSNGAIYANAQSEKQLQLLSTASPNKQQFSFPYQGPIYAGNIKNLAPQSISPFHRPIIQLPGVGFHYGSEFTHSQPRPANQSPTAQQQSTSNENIYANSQSEEQYNQSKEPKFQRLQEAPPEDSSEEELPEPPHQIVDHTAKTEQKVPVRETTITTFIDGRKTRVSLKTKPPLPLLDLSLLEPLTFDNPLVPQVQHFLPKISQATYHKLHEINQNGAKKNHKSTQKTKNYDSGNDKLKPKKFTPKKKQRYPLVEVQNSFYDEIPSASTVRPVVTVKETPNESPEISYEINSPNYKETYKEQAINYNKETKSEPVHYTYGTQKHEEPVHYTYVHSSKEPVHIKEVHYEGKGEGPKHFVQKFKSDEHKESDDSGESSEENSPPHSHNEHRDHQNEHINHNKHQEKHNQHNDHRNNHHENHDQHHDHPKKHHEKHNQHHEHRNNHHENNNQHHDHQNKHHENHNHHESPKSHEHDRPEHREQEYHHSTNSGSQQNHGGHDSFKPIQYYTKTSSGAFQPISEYEEEIRIAAPIKVDPNQHVRTQTEPRQQNLSPNQQQQNHPPAQQHYPAHQKNVPHNTAPPEPQLNHHSPTTHVHEKTKSIIIHEETPAHSGELLEEMFGEVDKEKDFEKAYKNAAFGFPAYGKSDNVEDSYSPDNYGVPREHSDYDFKNSPFQQYQDPSDSFPKTSRLSYKDAMDNTKEDYFLDFSISKPESLVDHHKKKVDYYKLYKQQKPNNEESQKKQKTSEKYTALPYSFYPMQDMNMKQYFAQYKAAPFVQEFDYSKGVPRDSSAHSTQPNHRYKSNTFFVEPQFQYGFEPISIPRLLDSELATMASNNSPESEEPGMRKKIYKENFHMKKTSVSVAGLSS